MKLPNGYSSVTKLSGNRRNPYMARVTLGRDDYGQLVRKTLGYYFPALLAPLLLPMQYIKA